MSRDAAFCTREEKWFISERKKNVNVPKYLKMQTFKGLSANERVLRVTCKFIYEKGWLISSEQADFKVQIT